MAKCIRTYAFYGSKSKGVFISFVERDSFSIQFVAHYHSNLVKSVECIVLSGAFITPYVEFTAFFSRLNSFLSGASIAQITDRENVYHDADLLF